MFERHWRLILAPALAAGALTVLLVGFVVKPTYRSSATLFVTAPAVVSDLNPSVLSVHGYKTLLESDAVLVETKRRLEIAGIVEADALLEIDDPLSVRIFVSRREETESLSPLIEASATAEDPDVASEMVNTWVEVFLERTREVFQGATEVDAQVAEEQYPQVRGELEERENQWVATASEFEAKIQEAISRGDRVFVSYQKATADLVAAHGAESRRLISELTVGASESLSDVVLKRKLQQLTAIRAQLSATLPIIVLEKAITDDALWQSLVSGALAGDNLSTIDDLSLVSTEVNPVFTELKLRAVALEEELGEHVGFGEPAVMELIRALDDLQRQRSIDLEKLQRDRGVEARILRRDQLRAVEDLERTRNNELGQMRREIDRLSTLESRLQPSYSQIVLARARDGYGVRLAAPAVPVLGPEPSRAILKAVVAITFGAVLGLFLAMVREVRA